MNIESIGLPVLALLIGSISLLINHNEKNKKSTEQRSEIAGLSIDNSKLISVLSEFKKNTESDLNDILSKLDLWFINPDEIVVSKLGSDQIPVF